MTFFESLWIVLGIWISLGAVYFLDAWMENPRKGIVFDKQKKKTRPIWSEF
jgi:hypothetical protein